LENVFGFIVLFVFGIILASGIHVLDRSPRKIDATFMRINCAGSIACFAVDKAFETDQIMHSGKCGKINGTHAIVFLGVHEGSDGKYFLI
jgi:hypothetical protein